MTREEATKLLEHISIAYTPTDAYGDYDDPQPYEEAIDMAIEALSEGNIARDIATIIENEQDMRVMLQNAERPKGDLVRCKDCRFWKNEHLCLVMSRYESIYTKAEHYCSWGERREE